MNEGNSYYAMKESNNKPITYRPRFDASTMEMICPLIPKIINSWKIQFRGDKPGSGDCNGFSDEFQHSGPVGRKLRLGSLIRLCRLR